MWPYPYVCSPQMHHRCDGRKRKTSFTISWLSTIHMKMWISASRWVHDTSTRSVASYLPLQRLWKRCELPMQRCRCFHIHRLQVLPHSPHTCLLQATFVMVTTVLDWKGFFAYGTKDAWYNTTIKKITTARVPFADGDPRASASTSAKAGEKRSPKAFWIHRVADRAVFHCVQPF